MNERDPGEAIARLTERLRDETAKMGLTLRQGAFLPNLEGGRHMFQAIFTVDDEATTADPDQARIDAEFEEMLLGQRRADRDQSVRDKLEKGMNLGGLLDDDDEEGEGDAPAPA